MSTAITQWFANIFDRIEEPWESIRGQRVIGTILVVSYLLALGVIELGRQNLLPPAIAEFVPFSHFGAVNFAFTLLLVAEVISLVFGLARSVSRAAGIQFELLSLILLRKYFAGFAEYPEPLTWEGIMAAGTFDKIVAEAAGALLIFIILGVYYRIQKHRPITADEDEQAGFIAAKKTIALFLLVIFAGIAFDAGLRLVQGRPDDQLFARFFTVLIFSDILIVLISLRYSSTFHVAFRNSGFAVATVFIRLALIAPKFIDVAIGVGGVLFMVGLSLAYNNFAPDIVRVQRGGHGEADEGDEPRAGPATSPTIP